MPRLSSHRSLRPVLLAVFALLVTCPSAQAAFPGTNGKIAFASPRTGAWNIFLMNADGTGQTAITNANDPNTEGNEYPAWSPDGTRIAFDSYGDGNFDIYTMNANGTGKTRVTTDPGSDQAPAWSPDGGKIAFMTDRDQPGTAQYEIYTMNAGGSDVTRLTSNSVWDGFPDWSPDGTRIVFEGVEGSAPANRELYTMNPDGSAITRLTDTPADDAVPNWSPDGKKIVFLSDRDDLNYEIYTMNADGSGVTRLTDNTLLENFPAWSPDGKKIAFVRSQDGSNDIYTMNANGTGQTRLNTDPEYDDQPDWQPLSYPRPKGATPFRASLVIAYRNCTAPNEQHGPALAHPSCAPPVQASDWLTTGSEPAQATQFVGSVRFDTLLGNPATPADEADVAAVISITDVRNKADMTDYAGDVQANVVLRITDRDNAVSAGGGGDAATLVDIPFPVDASCAPSADPLVGATCAVSTSLEAIVPGAVKEGKRAVWQMDAIQVYDGGADGDTATQPNTLFARQGVFVP